MRVVAIRLMLVAFSLLFVACASPAHLQKDFGFSYTSAFWTQADIDRPGAVDSVYSLTGVEALEIRAQAEAKATDEASAIPILVPVK